MKGKTGAYISIIAAAALWGSIGVFYQLLTAAGLDSMQAVVVRVALSALLYTGYLLLTDRQALNIAPRDCIYFIGTGICSLVLFNLCYFSAITRSSMAVAAVLLYTAPVFVTLLSAALFGERLTRIKLLSLALTLCGCLLVTGVLGSGGVSLSAILFGLGSGLGYALYSIFGTIALRKYSSKTVTVYSFLFASVGALPFAKPALLLSALSTPGGAVGGVCIAVVCCILPYLLYTSGLRRVEPGRASVMAALEPVVAAVLGICIYREPAGTGKLCGIALVIAAICLLSLTDRCERG